MGEEMFRKKIPAWWFGSGGSESGWNRFQQLSSDVHDWLCNTFPAGGALTISKGHNI